MPQFDHQFHHRFDCQFDLWMQGYIGRRLGRILIALILGGVATGLAAAPLPIPIPEKISIFQPADPTRARASYTATGHKAMVTSAHPVASAAGLAMLKAGGNAIDAAVATSFALAVVRPQSTGIGGGGFMLYYDAAAKTTKAYDFRERAPALARQDQFLDAHGQPIAFHYNGASIPDAAVNGHLAVAVPGLVKGLTDIHAQYGKLSLATVLAPAIAAATDGFPVYPALAERLADRAEVLKHFPGSYKVFFKNGRPLHAGELLIQKDLAWTLQQIAQHGADGFYKGAVAERLLAEMQRGGGLVSLADLQQYKMRERQPLIGEYRGFHIVSMPPPSSGGTHIIEIMNILAGIDYAKMGFGTAESLHWLAEAMRRAFADRAAYLGDPDFTKVPLKGLLSLDYATSRRATIKANTATPSTEIKAGNPQAYEHPSTTHLSVIDEAGNSVSSTQTVNYYFGSGVVAEGTGIVLNDEMDDFAKKPEANDAPNVFGLVGSHANAISPGKTPLSSMSPSLVFDSAGKLRLIVGSPGGPRIITATLQTILNVIDHRMNLTDAVHASRIHHQWLPDQLEVETGAFSSDVLHELKKMGHHVVSHGSMGDVEAIAVTDQGLTGVSDTRSDGRPMGY